MHRVAAFVVLSAAAVLSAAEPARLRVDGRANAFASIAAERAFIAVAWGATSSDGAADVYLAVSRDAGQSFSAPVRVNEQAGIARLGGELPPRVALVAAGEDPAIVVTWGAKSGTTDIRVSTSIDGGRSFRPSTPLSASGAAGDRGWHATTVDRRGVVHTLWLDHRGLATRTKTEHDHHGDGADMAQFSSLYYSASTLSAVGGSSSAVAAPPVRAAAERELTKGVCYCCKTAFATGADGTMYAAWRHVYSGNIRDIAFTLSRDGGKTFQAPERVSPDNWQLAGCPDDGPAIAVGPDGTAHLVWPTVVSDEGNMRGAIFYASTRDGRRFTTRIEVPTTGTPKPSHPQIVADEAGGFLVAWDEVRAGVRHAYARTLRLNAGRNPMFGDVMDFDPQGSAYPALAATSRGVFVAWAHGTGPASEIRVKRLE